MRIANPVPFIALAVLCAGCDPGPADPTSAVPPVTTNTSLTGPVNEAASDEAVIPVVADPPQAR
ncbi:hypothetical protein [Sphingomonas turrisvirgatae]|uniref:Uncharacterized protein n=1 Tax=Sphingomonas turrisvirgatae TaxID=1888892 RepID=A0A1E3LUX9_9SPHN|nr:hypothetical protein [Sphingomonas turrisvirgatae]ODP37577.1 hypothetical protein BFL28_17030 [Sphingomonas turrisvirgatae]